MAPEGMTMENWEYKNWGAKWGALMAWMINQQYFRENLKLRIGANIMGKRMFDQGARLARGGSVSHTGIRSYP
jgi:hypothetical protein